MNKRGLILLLVGVNALLLGAIGFTAYTPPSALAQAVGARRGEYLLFSGRADVTNDAIYLLDAGGKKLHIFRSGFPREPVSGLTRVQLMNSLDLAREFMGQGPAQPAGAPQQPLPGQIPPGGQRP